MSDLTAARYARVEQFLKSYKKRFGETASPDFISLAPGRVNLIGEHVDHQGYPVLPTALNHSILVAVSSHPPATVSKGAILTLNHEREDIFRDISFEKVEDIKVAPTPIWVNYIVASLFGLIEFLSGGGKTDFSIVGKCVKPNQPMPPHLAKIFEDRLNAIGATSVHLYVCGDVPIASGVSSSSSLVVASSAALGQLLLPAESGVPTVVNPAAKDAAKAADAADAASFCKQAGSDAAVLKKCSLPSRMLLADICANAERHTGVTGGGMDQAVICLSQRGQAQLIRFFPLSTEDVPIPDGGAIVVCDSCRSVPKAVSAAVCYNKRVFELKLASYMMLRAALPNEPDIAPEKLPTITLRNVQEKLGLTYKTAAEAVSKYIPPNALSRSDVTRILGKDRIAALLAARGGAAIWERNVYFEPFRRAFHVFNEAQRVLDFAAICQNKSLDNEPKLKQLGQLLNDSHESLSVFFDCGSPELTELTELAMAAGAYGARLTGAGWGGCMMSLVKTAEIPSFIEKMRTFYTRADRIEPLEPRENNYQNCVFAVLPDNGAMIFAVDGKATQELEWTRK